MNPTSTISADSVPVDTIFERAEQNLPCWVTNSLGVRREAPVQRWMGTSSASSLDRRADEAMLDLCTGPTIDLGCGPGRLTAALAARGVQALGVDASPTAVAMAASRGADVVHGNIFDPLPDVGGWSAVLLADGNIGIGADPQRVLRRAAQLISPNGIVVAEVEPSGATTGVHVEQRRWETDVLHGNWFEWATVGRAAVPAVAAQAGLQVTRTLEMAHRCFVWLERSTERADGRSQAITSS